MKILFALVLSMCLSGLLVGQGQKREPQTISTEPKEIMAELRTGDQKLANVRGEAVFTPSAGNADDTLTGTLAFNISEAKRSRIATTMKKSLESIPSVVKKDDVVTAFVKHAECPDLRFEFFVRHQNFNPVQAEIEFAGATLRFQTFVLSFKESQQELSQLLCVWAKRINGGRGTRGAPQRFSKIIKGEDSGK